jgi:hypothetical protein
MDPREIKEIMSEGAIRPETSRDRAERRALEQDLAGSPVKGRPLTPRLRNFRPDPANVLVAVGGPTAWMRRLREIEDATADHERRLATAWHELALETGGAEFERRWREVARSWTFYGVNDLIAKHNRNFPAEARLPMDPKTRDFVKVNGRPYRREPLDAEWILERFPPDHARALEAAAA